MQIFYANSLSILYQFFVNNTYASFFSTMSLPVYSLYTFNSFFTLPIRSLFRQFLFCLVLYSSYELSYFKVKYNSRTIYVQINILLVELGRYGLCDGFVGLQERGKA